jgi:hypothetical protein
MLTGKAITVKVRFDLAPFEVQIKPLNVQL